MNSGNWGGFRTLWCIFNRDCDMFSIIIFSRILFYRLVENAVRKHANRSEKTLHQVNCILCLPTNNNNNNNIYLSTAPQFLRIGIASTAVRHQITK